MVALLVTALLPALPLTASTALAATGSVTVSGTVKDDLGTPITGARVDVTSPGTTNVIVTSPTDSRGAYSVQVAPGTYDFWIVPPQGSPYNTYVSAGQVVTATKTLDFVLVRQEQGNITLSGVMTNGHGTALPGQPIKLSGTGTEVTTVTDSTGRYSFTVPPGRYQIRTETRTNDPAVVAAPGNMMAQGWWLSLTENRTLDIHLPLAKVNLLVQDRQGNPVANARVTTNHVSADLPAATFGADAAGGVSSYEADSKFPLLTDAAGRATLWLFPTDSPYEPYTISVAGETASGGVTTLISGDMDLNVVVDSLVTITGRVLNPRGQALPNQQISLTGFGTYNTRTDASGMYEFRVGPGSYKMTVSGYNSTGVAAPQSYDLSIANLPLTESRTFDISLPFSEVQVHVQDQAGAPVAGAGLHTFTWEGGFIPAPLPVHPFGDGVTVEGRSTYYRGSGPKTDAAGNATLWLLPRVAPPAREDYIISAVAADGQPYTGASIRNTAESDASLTITMLPSVTLSGVLRGSEGAPLPGQTMTAWGPNGEQSMTTDGAGRYAFRLSPGDWGLDINGENTGNVAAPNHYVISTAYTTLSGDRVFDISLPVKRVTVKVRDAAGGAVPGVALSTPTYNPVALLPLANFDASRYARATGSGALYPLDRPVVSDAAGEATLWLFPTMAGWPYGLHAAPPSTLPFLPFTKEDLYVPSDRNVEVEIVLPYTHPAPVTTATVEGPQDEAGTYIGAPTVKLSAAATAGYTVTGTYYRIDDGPVQTYTAPFRVIGTGTHVVRYWSKDNQGVTEPAKYLNLSVKGAEPPVVTAQVSPAPNEAGWHREDVTVSWQVLNAVSTTGCDPVTLSGETGGTVLTCSAANVEGAEASATVTVRIDRTAPVTKAVVGADYGVSLTSTDNLSGVRTTYYQVNGGDVQEGTSVTAPAPGTYTVTYWSEDIAGNVEAPKSIEVGLAPVINSPSSGIWVTEPGTIQVCGVAAPNAMVTLHVRNAGTGADLAVEVQADASGNWCTTVSLEQDGDYDLVAESGGMTSQPCRIRVDRNAPTTTATVTPAPSSGWYSGSVTVELEATDGENGSGVDYIEYSFDGITWQRCTGPIPVSGDGVHRVYYRAVDKAGNVEAYRELQIPVDSTPPSVHAEFDETTDTLTLTPVDDGSGIDLIEYSLDGGKTWLVYTGPVVLPPNFDGEVLWRCRDKAGHTTTGSIQCRAKRGGGGTCPGCPGDGTGPGNGNGGGGGGGGGNGNCGGCPGDGTGPGNGNGGGGGGGGGGGTGPGDGNGGGGGGGTGPGDGNGGGGGGGGGTGPGDGNGGGGGNGGGNGGGSGSCGGCPGDNPGDGNGNCGGCPGDNPGNGNGNGNCGGCPGDNPGNGNGNCGGCPGDNPGNGNGNCGGCPEDPPGNGENPPGHEDPPGNGDNPPGHEDPPGHDPAQGRITGGGSLLDGKLRVTHGFELYCDAAQGPNNLEVNWNGYRFHLTSLTSVVCSTAEGSPEPPAAGFNTYQGAGTGELNGVEGATVEFTITDLGEPGTRDTFTITIRDKDGKVVLQVSGTLAKGNHQAHAQ